MIVPTQAIVITTKGSGRLEKFQERWATTDASWQVPLEVFTGRLIGDKVRNCWNSHRSVMQSVTEPTLILEDDAVFDEVHFTLDVPFPTDTKLFYFGGEHMEPPKPTRTPGVVVGTKVRRTHAYVVIDPQDAAANLNPLHKRISYAILALKLKTYAVSPFTVGQAVGPSTIDKRSRDQDEFWNS